MGISPSSGVTKSQKSLKNSGCSTKVSTTLEKKFPPIETLALQFFFKSIDKVRPEIIWLEEFMEIPIKAGFSFKISDIFSFKNTVNIFSSFANLNIVL